MGNCSNDSVTTGETTQPKKSKIQYTSLILNDKTICQKFDSQILHKTAKKITNTPVQFKLIYRASQNGYDCSKLHNAVDGIGNTFLLVKTTNNKIFGAFSPCKWSKDVMYKYQNDKNSYSFIFSINILNQSDKITKNKTEDQQKQKEKKKSKKQEINIKIYKIKDKQKAIMSHSINGPIYGEGYDIMIADKCNKNENWCNLGKSYQSSYPFGSIKANCELVGQQKFLISQYQVWNLVI